MKLFENAKLDRISAALCMNTADCKIRTRYVMEGGRWSHQLEVSFLLCQGLIVTLYYNNIHTLT